MEKKWFFLSQLGNFTENGSLFESDVDKEIWFELFHVCLFEWNIGYTNERRFFRKPDNLDQEASEHT